MSSTADTGEVVTVDDEGVTVTKRFSPDEFPVPAIRFEIESTHDDPVTVRLSEDIPESFPMDGVGFHPEYHSDQWTAYQDHRVEFTGTVEPDESLVTVYGVRLDDDSAGERFLTEPSIVDVRPAESEPSARAEGDEVADGTIGEIVSEDRNQVVKDMLSGDSDGVPGLDSRGAGDESPGETGDAAGTEADASSSEDDREGSSDAAPDLDLDSGAEAEDDREIDGSDSADDGPEIELDIDAAAERVAETDESSAGPGDDSDDRLTTEADSDAASGVDVASHDSIAASLAAELRDGEIDESDLHALKKAFATDRSGGDRARLDHLQTRVEEVAAYTGALEEFLDENGTGAQLIEELGDDLESIRSELAELSDRIDATERTVASVDEDVADLDDRMDDIDTEVDGLSDRVDGVAADVGELDDGLEAVSDEVANLDDTVADVDDRIDSVDDELGELDSTVVTLEDDVETVSGEVDDVTSEVDELGDELADVRADVTDIVEWRDQLGSMFTDD